MKKRGLIILGAGATLLLISFGIAFTVLPIFDSSAFNNEILAMDLLDGMFDVITDESLVYPGDSTVFTFSSQGDGVPLLWGLQIVDFQDGDTAKIHISNIFGDTFVDVTSDDIFIFDMFMVQKADTFNFNIENMGTRPLTFIMMFSEDPENSDALSDPNSELMRIVTPLAISGILLLVGIAVILVGGTISIIDWKKERDSPRYYS